MRQQGVTLIQMMIGLAVAGLLTQLGATAYSQMSQELHRASLARELLRSLRDARTQATLRQRAVRVEPLEHDWGKGWRTTLEHSGQALADYRPARPATVVASDTRTVRFTARGAPLGMGFGGITLHVCRDSPAVSVHQVVLSPSGRVRLNHDEGLVCPGG